MKNVKIVATVLLVIVVCALVTNKVMEKQIVDSVISEQKELWCFIGKDYKKIDPEKVTAFIDGVWFFTNGSARQCELKTMDDKKHVD